MVAAIEFEEPCAGQLHNRRQCFVFGDHQLFAPARDSASVCRHKCRIFMRTGSLPPSFLTSWASPLEEFDRRTTRLNLQRTPQSLVASLCAGAAARVGSPSSVIIRDPPSITSTPVRWKKVYRPPDTARPLVGFCARFLSGRQRHQVCSDPRALMKYPRPQSTTERRANQDRRARTRSGRREHDPSPKHCPSCGGTDPVALGVTHGVLEYRCGHCQYTWMWLR